MRAAYSGTAYAETTRSDRASALSWGSASVMSAQGQAPSTRRLADFRSALDWIVRQWPVLIPMLVATVVFGGAVRLYPTIPLYSDATDYSISAWRLAGGGALNYGTAPPGDPNAKPNAIVTPVYPLFLSAFYLPASRGTTFEQAASEVHPTVLAAQLGLAVATVGVVAAFGLALEGSGLALVAGLLAAFYLPLAWASSVALSETLGTFLLACQMLLAIRLADTSNKGQRIAALLFGAVGAAVGLIRPAYVLWTAAPLVFLLVARKYPFRELARLTALAGLAFLLVMVPWWIRNAVELHTFIPLSVNAGNTALFSTVEGPQLTAPEQALTERVTQQGGDGPQAVVNRRLAREWHAGHVAFIKRRVQIVIAAVEVPYMASRFRKIAVNGKALERAVATAEAAGAVLLAESGRRWLGELAGGRRGEELRARSNGWMAQQGIQNPARLAHLVAPGFRVPA